MSAKRLYGARVKSDRRSGADLERVNAELRQSLEHCRELLAECRTKLASNGDEPGAADPTVEADR
jgi:hypothetical protein